MMVGRHDRLAIWPDFQRVGMSIDVGGFAVFDQDRVLFHDSTDQGDRHDYRKSEEKSLDHGENPGAIAGTESSFRIKIIRESFVPAPKYE